VAKKGAKRPIFEGNMPPKKMYPQYWRQYWRHNRNPVNGLWRVFVPLPFYLVGIFRLDVDSSGPLYPYNCSSFTLRVFFVTLCDVIVNFYV
jgi:hypothetical protein